MNVGTIGHIDFGRTMTAIALAGVMLAGNQLAIPTARRREFEPGFDLNQLLDDPGKRAERQARKAERRERLREAQRRAHVREDRP